MAINPADRMYKVCWCSRRNLGHGGAIGHGRRRWCPFRMAVAEPTGKRCRAGGNEIPVRRAENELVQTWTSRAGGVLAFESTACPAGWSEYKPSQGRFIRAINRSATPFDPLALRESGSFQEADLGAHKHSTLAYNQGIIGYKRAGQAGYDRFDALNIRGLTVLETGSSAGERPVRLTWHCCSASGRAEREAGLGPRGQGRIQTWRHVLSSSFNEVLTSSMHGGTLRLRQSLSSLPNVSSPFAVRFSRIHGACLP